ncbi:MAG: sensor histidine kinase [Limisphaerales bacterium]
MFRDTLNILYRSHCPRVAALFILLATGEPALAQSDPLPERIVTHYALTSTHDYSYYDPRDWLLLGSTNGGESWTTLDAETNQLFSKRHERRVFEVANPTAFNIYQLKITRVNAELDDPNPEQWQAQLAEIELLGPLVGVTNESAVGTLITSSHPHPLTGLPENAFDNDLRTRWVDFGASEPGGCWIQCQYVHRAETAILITNISQFGMRARLAATHDLLLEKGPGILSNLTAGLAKPRRLVGYALTSANDVPQRDPSDWRLLGSDDGGGTWKVLDIRHQERFATRFKRRVFTLTNSCTFALYQLKIDNTFGPGQTVQIAEVEPIYAARDDVTPYSLVVSAQTDNPPQESAEMAFDGDAKTKWLSFDPCTPEKPNWIQWQCIPEVEGLPVINLRGLDPVVAAMKKTTASSAPSLSVRPVRVNLEGVIVSRTANSMGLLDETGFQMFALDSTADVPDPGSRICLMGHVRFGGELPELLDREIDPLDSLEEAGTVNAEQLFKNDQTFLTGAAEGTATTISQGRYYTTIRLADPKRTASLRVKILNPGNVPLTALTRQALTVHGVIQPVFDDQGRRVAGTIWAASPDDVAVTPRERGRRRTLSVEEICRANNHSSGYVHVRGTLVQKKPDGTFILGQGTNRLVAHGQQKLDVPIGAVANFIGCLTHEGNRPVLYFACAQAVENKSAVASKDEKSAALDPQGVATDIWQVNELIKNNPARRFPVRIRGVITYIDLGLSTFYLQNGSNGIPVEGSLKAGLYPLLEQEGTYVEIQGLVKNGILSCAAAATVLGKGRIPEPLRHSWDYMMTGRDDGVWVQVEGVVTAFEKQRLTLAIAGGEIIVWVNQMDKDVQQRLLGSLVRVSGICGAVVNSRNQRLGLRLLVPSGEYVELVTALSDNPFDLSTKAIGKVMQLDEDNASLATQLVKTAGIVTYKAPDMLFVQDGEDGIRVLPREETPVEPGDAVEVVGLAEPDGFSPKLAQALLRKVSHGPLPAPKALDLLALNQDNTLSGKDATRGWIEATYLGMSANDSLQVLRFRPDKSETTFSAFLPATDAAMPSIPPGSRVRVEGVFKAKTDIVPDFGQVITSFEVYLNSPADLTVLARPPWWNARHTVWVLGGLALVLLLALEWVRSLRSKVARRTRQLSEEVEERRRTGAKLEAEIAEREKMQIEMQRTHDELLTASRKAGMAEVAIGVLHNVGNVLNSVNVSSSLVSEKIRASKISHVSKLSTLLQENAQDLPGFFDSPKGRQVPAYLSDLSALLSREHGEIVHELRSLTSNVEHIKEIIAVQQSYARVSGVFEEIQMTDLLEDTLRMNESSFDRHDIKVVREYGVLPPVCTDKHKVLQILINLLRNAKFACNTSGRTDKRIVLKAINGEGRVKIAIADNGVGIPPENLTRIFQHGFTTRKDGHGFGLHSGALAAKELGGSLTVQSEGAGRGAIFTLELPCRPPAINQQKKALDQAA